MAQTVSDFVETLGGNTAAASLFGVGVTAICNWKKAGRFPSWTHLKAIAEAERRGVKLTKRSVETVRPGAKIAAAE